MTEYGIEAGILKELLEQFKANAEEQADVSDYYRGKAAAFEIVLTMFTD